MKTIITVFLFFLISATALSMEGFHKADTIWYKFDKVLIEVASINALQEGLDVVTMKDRVEQIQKVLAELTIASPTNDERINISFKGQDEDSWDSHFKEIELSRIKQNSTKLVMLEDGTTFEKEFGHYCIAFSYRAKEMKIFIDDLKDLEYFSTIKFTEKVQMASTYLSKEYEKRERKRIVGWLDMRGEEVKPYFSKIANQNYDMLILSGGIGSGWIKNTFVSDLNFRLGLSFGNKGMYKNIYAIDYSMMYDFSESNENKFFELNHFVSLSWEHNFSNTPVEDKWYGFSVGYLVKRNNDFFKDNTFKISVNKKINNTFIVKPELYFNDFFKNVYPGVRLSVAF